MINFPKKNFEWNLIDIYNYNNKGKLFKYFELIKKNINLDGDFFEAGVFRGHTLLSVALFLKKIKSKKKIYGFDTFSGFPPVYHKKDGLINYKKEFKNKKITKDQYLDYLKMKKIIKLFKKKIDSVNISSSGNFSNNSLDLLKKKINYLGLDNICLIKGPFDKTMPKFSAKLVGGIVDCDLYDSYKSTLKYLWPLININGFIFLDEYYSLKFPGAKIATDEFLLKKQFKRIEYKVTKNDFNRCIILKK